MAPIVRSDVIKAKPETIWKLFAPSKWPIWDKDVAKVIDYGADEIVNGATFTMIMNQFDTKVYSSYSEVETNKFLKYDMSFTGVHSDGSFLLEPVDEEHTKFTYTFRFTGCLGAVFGCFVHSQFVDAVEVGVAKVKEIAENDEKTAE